MVAYFYEDLLVLSIVDIFGLICCFENNYFFRVRLVFSLYKKGTKDGGKVCNWSTSLTSKMFKF